MPRNGNGKARNDGKQRRKVERWETLEVLHSGRETTAKADISLVVEIKQPIFEDGAKGFPKMNATLSRGDRFLRFSCFDGDVSEIKALSDLLNGVIAQADGFSERYDGFVEKHKSSQQRGGGDKKHGGVGGGLSRFSDQAEGKTERRRRKRHERGERRP